MGHGNWTYPEKDWMGSKETYRIGAEWLADMDEVYDWGCGKGYARQFIDGIYYGVDSTKTPAVTILVEDLEKYAEPCQAIFMRHVLEHNENWEKVLRNALHSFREKMVLILFKDLNPGGTDKVNYESGWGGDLIPVINLSHDKFKEMISPYFKREIVVKKSPTKKEFIYYLAKEVK